jgi:hypothetical protein
MKKVLLPLLLACSLLSFSQSLKKYAIGKTGCSAYFYCDPGTFELSYSPDSSKVYTGECDNDGISYGVICIKMAAAIDNINDAEEVLISYLDYLKISFKISSSAGYGKGHRLKEREDTRGIIDYWIDDKKDNWKIKGWTDGKCIAVMYAYGKKQKELPETKLNVFLDSFRLPGM